MRVYVISIKPQFAEKIYSGEKEFEFRKKPPTNLDALYLIYETAPVSKITGCVKFCASFTCLAYSMAGMLSTMMKVKRKDVVKYMGISEKNLIEYAGGLDRFVTALYIQFAGRDKEYEKYPIRPPQNWGTIKMEGGAK